MFIYSLASLANASTANTQTEGFFNNYFTCLALHAYTFFSRVFYISKTCNCANTANNSAFVYLYDPSTLVTLPSSPLSVSMHALRSSCACDLRSTSMPKTNGSFMSTTKNRIFIQQLLLNQTGILYIVVPCIWDPFGNCTVFGLQSSTGGYKACMHSLGTKLFDEPVSTKKTTVSP